MSWHLICRQGALEDQPGKESLRESSTNDDNEFPLHHTAAFAPAASAHRAALRSALNASAQHLENNESMSTKMYMVFSPIIERADRIEQGPQEETPFSAFVNCLCLASSKDQYITLPPLKS